jgi:hypothetical protein
MTQVLEPERPSRVNVQTVHLTGGHWCVACWCFVDRLPGETDRCGRCRRGPLKWCEAWARPAAVTPRDIQPAEKNPEPLPDKLTAETEDEFARKFCDDIFI